MSGITELVKDENNSTRQVHLISQLEAANQQVSITPFEREREESKQDINAFVGRQKQMNGNTGNQASYMNSMASPNNSQMTNPNRQMSSMPHKKSDVTSESNNEYRIGSRRDHETPKYRKVLSKTLKPALAMAVRGKVGFDKVGIDNNDLYTEVLRPRGLR